MYLLILVVMGAVVLGIPQEYGQEYGTTHTSHKDPSTPYGFSYTVQDPNSGVDLGHSEESDGGTVLGQYTVLLPDGRRQTVQYQADHHRGFQPTIGYEMEEDKHYQDRHFQESTNDHIKFQYPKNVENIRTFPANREIIVDHILPQMIDENSHKYYRNDKSFVSNKNVYTFQSHIEKTFSELNSTNEKAQIIGTHENNPKNEFKIQMENSNIYTYNDSNIYFSNGKENKLKLLNDNASNSVRTLQSISKTHQYGPSLIEEPNRPPFNTNKSTKEEELHEEGHKKSIKEHNEEDEFPTENKHFMKVSNKEKEHVDSQGFKEDFEMTSVKVNDNLRNYETSAAVVSDNNNQVIRNTIVIENADLANSNFEIEKNEKIDNVNLPNSIWQLNKDQSNNNVNKSEHKQITATSDNADNRKQLQLTNYNTDIKSVEYSHFNDHNIPDGELDAYLTMAIGEGFGSKVASISSDIISQKSHENDPIVHGDLITREGNDVHLSNKNSFITTPIDNETPLQENENANNSEKLQKFPLSIYTEQVQFNKRNTESNILAREMYLNDDSKDDEISEIPHDIVPSHNANGYASIRNENYENDNLHNKQKLTHAEVNPQNEDEYSPNLYTLNSSDSVLKDITKSGSSIVYEPIENSNDTSDYDINIIYEYHQFYDDYENYDTFNNQPENRNEEENEFAISDKDSFSMNYTEGVQAVTIEKELNIINLSDKNSLEKKYLPDKESFVSRQTQVEDFFINQTSNNYLTNKNPQNDSKCSNNSPKMIKDDILESPSSYNINQPSDYLYDETTEFYETGYYPIIEQDFNVTDYELEDIHGNIYEISTIQNTKQEMKKDNEHSQMKNILSENNIYDSVSINPIEFLTFPAEKISESVEEIEPNFQTGQPNIVVLQTHKPDTVDIKTYLSVTTEKYSKKYENILQIPSDYQTLPKRKFTRLNKESIVRQLPERFKQFLIPSAIGVMSDHGSHPHRPTKNFLTKQNLNDGILAVSP